MYREKYNYLCKIYQKNISQIDNLNLKANYYYLLELIKNKFKKKKLYKDIHIIKTKYYIEIKCNDINKIYELKSVINFDKSKDLIWNINQLIIPFWNEYYEGFKDII